MGWQDVVGGTARYAVERADCLEALRALPDGCVDACVTSPPYELARLYLEDGRDLGIARDTEAWVAWMVEVCEELRRVCRGLCALVVEGQTRDYRYSCSPFLLMADLHRRGFRLRKPPVYHRVGIPGSGGPDWLRNDWEPVVCFAHGKLPWSDNTAMGAPPKYGVGGAMSNRTKNGVRAKGNKWGGGGTSLGRKRNGEKMGPKPGCFDYSESPIANPGNVISCNVGGGHMGSDLAHDNEAPFPERLAEFFVRSFCTPGGIVLDCFSGSGTTGAVAVRWGRRFVGFDVRQSQVDLSLKRIEGETPCSLFV